MSVRLKEALLVFSLCVGLGALVFGCEKTTKSDKSAKSQAPKSSPGASSEPQKAASAPVPAVEESKRESVINAFRLVETSGEEGDDVQRVWELVAATAKRQGEEEIFNLQDVTLKFYKEDKVVGTLTGKQGMFDKENQKGSLSGGIVGVSNEGYQLETASLSWEKKTQEITTSDPVKITMGRSVVDGSGMKASLNMKKFITKNVKGRIIIAEN